MKIAILGAGAWGTALAVSAGLHPGQPHQVSLWARDPQQARAMQQQRVNRRYLPDIALPGQVAVRAWPLDASGNAPASITTAARLSSRALETNGSQST